MVLLLKTPALKPRLLSADHGGPGDHFPRKSVLPPGWHRRWQADVGVINCRALREDCGEPTITVCSVPSMEQSLWHPELACDIPSFSFPRLWPLRNASGPSFTCFGRNTKRRGCLKRRMLRHFPEGCCFRPVVIPRVF